MDSSELQIILQRVAAIPEGTTPTPSDAEALYSALQERPYFTAAAVALLLHWPDEWDEERLKSVRHALALVAPCSRTVWHAAKGSDWSNFYPEAVAAPTQSTEDVIDTFLNTYGTTSPEEEAQLEKLIFNPTPDYAELLARQEQEELPDSADDIDPDSPDARINAFIRSQHPARPVEPTPEQHIETDGESKHPIKHPEVHDDTLLSESLAKIFIKQGRYQRAFEIISGLSLKFPKKSAYFADQLRFLQKLIINQRCLERQKSQETAAKQS